MISPNRGENKKCLKPPPSYLHESHKSKPNVGKYSIHRAIQPYCAVLYQLWLWKIVSIVAPRIFHISAGMAAVNKKITTPFHAKRKQLSLLSFVFFFSGNKNRLLCQKIPLNLPGDNCKLSPFFDHNKQGQMNVTPLKYLESESLHSRLKTGNHLANFEKK